MEIKINLNEIVDLNKRIIRNGGKPIEPHFPKEDEDGYCKMNLWELMNLYSNYMLVGHQNVFKPFEIIYKYEVEENDR